MEGRIIRLLVFLAVTTWAQAAGWDTLTGGRLKDSAWNDGDSFHVLQGGKEFIFRLCYVDTPETKAHKDLTKRTTAQARYWKIRKKDMFPLAAEAAAYTESLLAGGFTIKTRWEDAKGDSRLPRYFGVIITPQGDLAELLVAKGYARVYGFSPDYPGGTSADRYKDKLKSLEDKARDKELGAWAFSKSAGQPAGKSAESPDKKKPAATPAERKSGRSGIPAF